ncbi:MAG: hypothetical protein AAGI13_01595 [Pseudomonadota bacterium]
MSSRHGPKTVSLYEAISLCQQQYNAMYQLWAFYTATILGSIVFSTGAEILSHASIFLFLIAFWAFALGELALMLEVLKRIRVFQNDISELIKDPSEEAFYLKESARLFSGEGKRNNQWISILIQLTGNASVTVILMRDIWF